MYKHFVAIGIVALALVAGFLTADVSRPAQAAPTVDALSGVPSGPDGLDRQGRSIPDTDYEVPVGAIFISPHGNDKNPGTEDNPVKTVNRAVDLAPAEGTIVFRGGTYQDWYHAPGHQEQDIVGKSLTFQAAPHEKPWLDGADRVPASRWTHESEGRWAISWKTPAFCAGQYYDRPLDRQSVKPNNGPCAHFDASDNPSNPSANDPQMAFVNGQPLQQVNKIGNLTEDTFYYDWKNRRLYIGQNPAGAQVELSRRPVALVLGGNADYRIRGIGFRRFATNEYSNLTAGAVYIGGSQAKIENSVFVDNAAAGLIFSSPQPGTSIRSSVFANNGYTALLANGSSAKTKRNDFVIADSVFNGNNSEGFGENCTVSCGQAAVKLAHMQGFTIARNLVQNTHEGSGLWCDLLCRDGKYISNAILDNDGKGIFHEVSDTAIIAGNFIRGGQYGIAVASANTKIYNNTLINNVQGINIYDDARTLGVGGWDDVGPDTRNISVVNNIVVGRNYSLLAYPVRNRHSRPNTAAPDFFDRVSHNAFHQSNGAKPVFVYWRPMSGDHKLFRTPKEFAAQTGLGTKGLWNRGSKDPYFVDAAHGNYAVRDGSAAYLTAEALPADVAKALGVSQTGSLSRGALTPS